MNRFTVHDELQATRDDLRRGTALQVRDFTRGLFWAAVVALTVFIPGTLMFWIFGQSGLS